MVSPLLPNRRPTPRIFPTLAHRLLIDRCGTQSSWPAGRRVQPGLKKRGYRMKLRHLLVAAALALTTTTAWAQGFSDTSMGVRDGPWISNPGGGEGSRNVNKIIANFAHFDVWNYGSNFFNVDILFSNANEPANNSAGGSTEFYAVYRGQFSPDKIFGINTAFGPISAVNFEIGGDAES